MTGTPTSDRFRGPTTSRRTVLLTLAASATAGVPTAAASVDEGSPAFDVRRLSLTDERRTVAHASDFDDPVVVATPPSYVGSNEAFARIDRVGPDGFDAAIEEWSFLDGSHKEEVVGCITAESGLSRFDDGPMVAAGTLELGTEWTRVKYDEVFPKPPIVLTGTQTTKAGRPVIVRNRKISTHGVSVRIQGSEDTPAKGRETVGYVAVERGQGTLGGRPYEGRIERDVSDDWHTIEFDGEYDDPVFLADLRTSAGMDAASLRYRNLDGRSVEVFLEEERSQDDETWHTEEDIGYVVFEGGGTTTPPPTDEPEPDGSDPDGSDPEGWGRGGYGRGWVGA